MHFGSTASQWCKKVAFTDPHTERRITLKMGDYVKLYDTRLGRVDVFFVHDHDASQRRRLFAKVTPVLQQEPPEIDECLDLPIMKVTPLHKYPYVFVGLPNIHAEKLYMVPVRTGSQAGVPVEERSHLGDSTNDTVVWVKWTLQYL